MTIPPQMNPLEKATEFSFNLTFGLVVLQEIFLPSYFGSEVSVDVDVLSNAIYESDWLNAPPVYRRNVVIYMEYLKKPQVIKAVHIMPMSRESFAWVKEKKSKLFVCFREIISLDFLQISFLQILNKSYSIFALLEKTLK